MILKINEDYHIDHPMRIAKVVESIEIAAPQDEVFDIIVNCDRRLQLSPLWGVAKLMHVSPDFPAEGSCYHVRLNQEDGQEYDTIVTDLVPKSKFGYRLTTRRETRTVWTMQAGPKGTRLVYYEEFLVEDSGEEEFVQSVRNVVRQWLANIRRYAELRGSWQKRFLRRLVDRFLLPLRVDQRRVIFLALAWQAVSCLAFLAVALGFGVAKLLGLV
ncbi:MAG: hypothetical protein D6784_01465 [Chloroflexi bacterium]|nr:MAG: hypothetical protein D6784_01465 [Chloroflexota bacterium]